MSDKELIKQEIERIIEEETQISKGSDYYHGVKESMEKLLKFIDSLQEEPASEDLEEALAECVNRRLEIDEFANDSIKFAFIEGAEWQKQQMMKDVVELHIIESFNPIGTEDKKPHGFTALCDNAEYPDFYPVMGQTIKVIPIKNDFKNYGK